MAVLVSGLGATPVNELYILNDTIEAEIVGRGLIIHKTYVGNYFTSLEMVGATLTVMALDAELKRLLDVDVDCPAEALGNKQMQQFDNASAGDVVPSLADRIIENRAYLSEIDGKIGDGDHGVNMAKGFGMAADRIRGNDMSLASAFDTLGTVLMTEIGGSMGPLYGDHVHPVRRNDRSLAVDRRRDLQRHAGQRP